MNEYEEYETQQRREEKGASYDKPGIEAHSMKCIVCKTWVERLGTAMPSNFRHGVDVTFHAHYGSKHDMCMISAADLKKQIHAVICDDCYTEVKENALS